MATRKLSKVTEAMHEDLESRHWVMHGLLLPEGVSGRNGMNVCPLYITTRSRDACLSPISPYPLAALC